MDTSKPEFEDQRKEQIDENRPTNSGPRERRFTGPPRLVGGAEAKTDAMLLAARERLRKGDLFDVTAVNISEVGISAHGQQSDELNYYLPNNRLEWWGTWENQDIQKRIMTGAFHLSDYKIEDGFKSEFNPALASVVTFESLAESQSPHSLPGIQFAVMSGTDNLPVIRNRVIDVRDDDGARIKGREHRVLINETRPGKPEPDGTAERPRLVLVFQEPQRAVCLDYGFIRGEDSSFQGPISSDQVEMTAYRGDESSISAFGRDYPQSSLPDWVDPNTAYNRIGVRDQKGDIRRVELRFRQRDPDNQPGLFVTEPQVIYRVWHEPFPAVVVRQGQLSRGDRPRIRLPFRCDNAIALLRGFKVGFNSGPQEIDSMSVGISCTIGRDSNNLPPYIEIQPHGGITTQNTDNPPSDYLTIYYTLITWREDEMEIRVTPGNGTIPQDEERLRNEMHSAMDSHNWQRLLELARQAGNTTVTSPDPWRYPDRGMDPAISQPGAYSPVYAGLTGFSLVFPKDSEISYVAFIGIGAGRTGAPDYNLVWPVGTSVKGPDSYHAQVSCQFLTGRSVQLLSGDFPKGTGRTYLNLYENRPIPVAVKFLGERPDPLEEFHWQWDEHASYEYGIAWPINAEAGLLSPGYFKFDTIPWFFSGSEDVRDMEVEVQAVNYSGSMVEWQFGGGLSTDDPGSDGGNLAVIWPHFAGLNRKSRFTKPVLVSQGITFEGGVPYAVMTSPTQFGAIRNVGDAQVFITDARIEGPDSGSFSIRCTVTYEDDLGQDPDYPRTAQGSRVFGVESIAYRQPLRLLPGEAIVFGGRFLPLVIRPHLAYLVFGTNDPTSTEVRIPILGRPQEHQGVGVWLPDHYHFSNVPTNFHINTKSKRFGLQSIGQTPLLLYKMRVEDPSTGFQIGLEHQSTGFVEWHTAYPENNDGPEDFMQIEPGDIYFVKFGFKPPHSGEFHSRIIAETSAGDLVVELRGFGVDP